MSISCESTGKNSISVTHESDGVSERVRLSVPMTGCLAPTMVQPAIHAETHDDVKINFFEMIPLEVRLQVLDFVVRRRHPVTASDDLISYAKTCKTGSADRVSYHEIIGDPQQSLLASRPLINKAWAHALLHGLSSRVFIFQNTLQKFVSTYTAVYLDVRGDTTWLAYKDYQKRAQHPFSPTAFGPESITAVLRAARPAYIHLKCGFPEGEGIINNACHVAVPYLDDYMAGCWAALFDGCRERLNQGVRLPTIFLEVSELTLSDLLKYLAKEEYKFTILGLCLHGAMKSMFDTQNLQDSHRLQLEGPCQIDSTVWSVWIEKMGALKYLYLEGWGGDSMVEGIVNWLKNNQSLVELHLTNCCLGDASIQRLCQALKQHESLKCLAIDGYHYFDNLGETLLATLLENTPDLVLILGRRIPSTSPLECHRLNGRVICDHYPKAMRDLPEIYGDADFFASSYR